MDSPEVPFADELTLTADGSLLQPDKKAITINEKKK